MPYLSIATNQNPSDAQCQQLLQRASALVAAQLGKPERYVMIDLRRNPAMRFADSDAPLAYVELKSIGLPVDSTAGLSQALCALIRDTLGVHADRVYIEFTDAPRHMWGWNGATF